MSTQQPTETPREHKDSFGIPRSLNWLVENEPEWAANQIRQRDKLEAELNAAKIQWANDALHYERRLTDEHALRLTAQTELTAAKAEIARLGAVNNRPSQPTVKVEYTATPPSGLTTVT